MFDSWSGADWLLVAVAVGWALRLSYKFGLETGKDELIDRLRRNPQQTLSQIEAERSAEGRFRRRARGRRE